MYPVESLVPRSLRFALKMGFFGCYVSLQIFILHLALLLSSTASLAWPPECPAAN